MNKFHLASLVIGLFLLAVAMPAQAASEKETALERVLRTGVLRCGYGAEMPYLYKDAATGEMKGIFYDYMEELAKTLSIRIDWAEEMGWGQFPTALESGRIDAFCSCTAKTGGRARSVDYVTPVVYDSFMLVTRPDEHRFDNNIEALNDPSVTFVGMEGQNEVVILRERFPKAKIEELPQITGDFSQAMMNVATGKADAILVAGSVFATFDKKFPEKLVPIPGIKPLQMMSTAIVIKAGEHDLRRMLDNGTMVLHESGKIESIIRSYDLPDGTFYSAVGTFEPIAK